MAALPELLTTTQVLNKSAVVQWTNRAQAICITLADTKGMPPEVAKLYEEANEKMKQAMRKLVL